MNRYFFPFIIGVSIILTSCQSQSFHTPKIGTSFLAISHIKEPTITFVDMESKKVLFSEEILFPFSEMVKINDRQMIATSQTATSLFLIDLEKGVSTPILEVNQGLAAIHYDFSTQLLYVADRLNDQVHVININKKEVVYSIEVGTSPSDLQVVENTLFVLNGESNDVTVIDTTNQVVIDTFPVLDRPAGMYIDGDVLWIGGHGSIGKLNKSIVAYDTKTFEQVNKIEVGLMPVAFYSDQQSPFFYVLCHGDHNLYKIEKNTSEIVDSVEVGQNPNFVTGNADTLFVTNLDDDSVTFIDQNSFTLVKEISVPTGPYAIILEESK